jgi:deoxyribodipyrimidine photo-lyase
MPRSAVPALRVRAANEAAVRPDGGFVLYWMIAARRTRWNFGLQRAVELARELERPLVVLEALRCGHRWASARSHRFVLDGMHANAAACAGRPVTYWPYVEPEPGAGRGLVAALGREACAVVTDEFPTYFLPRMVAAAARALPVRLEAVDSNGLLPLRAAERDFARAVDFRRFLQRELPRHLAAAPRADPLARVDLRPLSALPGAIARRWPRADESLLAPGAALAALPIDHAVGPVPLAGGAQAAERALRRFLAQRLDEYGERRNHPDDDASSGLSPYLHFGHLATHQVLAELARCEDWSADRPFERPTGKREGWWGMRPAAEAFLDELVTWRELGYVFCHRRQDHAEYGSLPAWSRKTLAEHAHDRRPHLYTLARLEQADTHDELWNAAQNQLRLEGRIHNYLRMLWGKQVLNWTASPQRAFEALIELNDKYALDGRDPNSYSGIGWVLGRFDRPWGPERKVLGTVRYMTSASTLRKLRAHEYVERWSDPEPISADVDRR